MMFLSSNARDIFTHEFFFCAFNISPILPSTVKISPEVVPINKYGILFFSNRFTDSEFISLIFQITSRWSSIHDNLDENLTFSIGIERSRKSNE